jgi:putative lipoprotein
MPRLLTLLLTAILTACTAADAPASPRLAGTAWTLSSLDGVPLGPNIRRAPTIHFRTETNVGGNGGCNTWGGTYELKGSTIKFGQMQTTLMACEGGTNVEGPFHDMLGRTRTVAASGTTLVFKDARGTEIALFTPRATP